jgi:hypothetical protein
MKQRIVSGIQIFSSNALIEEIEQKKQQRVFLSLININDVQSSINLQRRLRTSYKIDIWYSTGRHLSVGCACRFVKFE